jgi:hypothetical protein
MNPQHFQLTLWKGWTLMPRKEKVTLIVKRNVKIVIVSQISQIPNLHLAFHLVLLKQTINVNVPLKNFKFLYPGLPVLKKAKEDDLAL